MSEQDDDYPDPDLPESEPMVLRCGYPGCCMPGYHFRHECHNAQDLMRLENAMTRIVENDKEQP